MENSLSDFLVQLTSILDFDPEEDIRSFLKLLLQRSKAMLESDCLCIYRAPNETLMLTKIAAIESRQPFPRTIPLEELQMPWTGLWESGADPRSHLQRFAQKAGLSYMTSTPIGRGQALFGLIVAGGYHALPDPELHLQKLRVIGSVVESAIDKQILVDAVQNQGANELAPDARSLVFANTSEGVLVLDPSLRIVEMNNAAEQLLGYSLREVLRQPVADILVGADGLMDALEVAYAGIETRELGLNSLHRRDGQAFSAHIQSFPVLDADDQLDSIVILVSDESEYEENRIKVQHLEQRAALGGLSAIFAHEVRNPINNISTAVQLLKVRMPQEDPNYEVLNRIQNDCSRLITLMESVLAFSRPIEPKLQPVDINSHLFLLLERWRPRLERLGIDHFLQKSDNPVLVFGDPRLMEQIFTNLISNAVDVMEHTGGSLAIKIARNDIVFSQPQVEVAISDTGPGIPDDIIEKIFDPFISTKPKGTGLGLAITKHMVTAQQGTIRVNSFPGGSVFYVNLPEYRGE